MDTLNRESLRKDPGFWIVIIILCALMFISVKCQAQRAQCDTLICHVECIQKIIPQKTKSGKTKFYAVYIDKQYSISDLIPVSNSVLEYVDLCKQNSITPNLGIRIRNGQITSIVKRKTKYK